MRIQGRGDCDQSESLFLAHSLSSLRAQVVSHPCGAASSSGTAAKNEKPTGFCTKKCETRSVYSSTGCSLEIRVPREFRSSGGRANGPLIHLPLQKIICSVNNASCRVFFRDLPQAYTLKLGKQVIRSIHSMLCASIFRTPGTSPNFSGSSGDRRSSTEGRKGGSGAIHRHVHPSTRCSRPGWFRKPAIDRPHANPLRSSPRACSARRAGPAFPPRRR